MRLAHNTPILTIYLLLERFYIMKQLIYLAALAFVVFWVHNRTEEERPIIETEKQCIKEAVGYDEMQECFKLMDKHKAEREKR